jgi:hypothetical protein
MALSFVALPPNPHPAYNPHVYYLDSTNKNQPAFRYVVQIFAAGTTTLLAEMDIAPRPVDGYGYVDVSKIIQSQINNALVLTNTTFYSADDSAIYEYDVKFGEDYTFTWAFDDYQFNIGPNFLGQTDLISFTTPHGLAVGNQIYNVLTTIYSNFRDAINGYFTVVDVPNPFTITINLNFPGSAPLTPGTTQLAAGTGPRFLNLINDLGVVAWNRAYTFEAFTTYATNQVLPLNPTTQIQSNAPTDFKAFDWQHLHWNFYDGKTNGISDVRFVNDAGETFRKSTSSTTMFMKAVPCGPGNLGALAPVGPVVLPLIKPTTQYYDVYATSAGTQSTQSKRVYIDRRCPINETQILFMDRAGSWSSFAFTLRQRENITVARQEFRKELGDLGGGGVPNQWGYQTSDAGLTNFDVDFNTQYSLSTDFMSEGMNRYFAECVTSPEAYIRFDTTSNWRRIIITDMAYEIQSRKNKRLIRADLNIRLAVDDQVNI